MKMIIDGKPADASNGAVIEVTNPANGKVIPNGQEKNQEHHVLLTGRGSQVGSWLCKNPDIHAITLTGSAEVGIETYKNAAGHLAHITGFDTLDEAIEIANASIFGLCGCIFTADMKTAWQTADGLFYAKAGRKAKTRSGSFHFVLELVLWERWDYNEPCPSNCDPNISLPIWGGVCCPSLTIFGCGEKNTCGSTTKNSRPNTGKGGAAPVSETVPIWTEH